MPGIVIEDPQGEGRLQGVDLLHLVILVAVLQGGLGHHQPTGTQDWASPGTIYLLRGLAMLLLRGIWKRSSQGLAVSQMFALSVIEGLENLVDLVFYPWKGMKMLMQPYVQLIIPSGMVELFLWKNRKQQLVEAFIILGREE